MESETIIAEIIKNKDKILSNLKQKDTDKYCYIKKRFEDGNILNDLKFQAVFKQFYIMNSAGLSEECKKCFFRLLSEKQCDLKYILSELYEIPRLNKTKSIQFSFATKLIHTVDNRKPIYDRFVGYIIDKKVEGISKDEKIASCLKIYNFLDNLYQRIINDNKIKHIINDFRVKFNASEQNISDEKILDFMLWSLGSIAAKRI